jgi:hypothetical protein
MSKIWHDHYLRIHGNTIEFYGFCFYVRFIIAISQNYKPFPHVPFGHFLLKIFSLATLARGIALLKYRIPYGEG